MEKNIVIDVRNISKKYIIATDYQPDTLRDKIVELAKYPFRALKGHTHKPKTKEYWALKNISFQVAQGEVLGIIGKNGAGKSTLLKILARITDPTSGIVTMKGRVASLLEVGTGFNPELTGRENIYLNGAIIGMSKKEISSKFNEIVNFSGIGDFLDTPVKRYSSGMYVRLAFSVAAYLDSDILLLDEVLAVGDTEFQKKCLQKVEQMVREEKKTVIFISHNMGSVRKLCDRVIYIKNSSIQLDSKEIELGILAYTEGLSTSNKVNFWISSTNKKDNQWFSATKMYLTGNKGIPKRIFTYDEQITFNIEGKLHKYHNDFQIGYAIYDEKSDELLYWCSFNDNPIDEWPTFQPGNVGFQTKLPYRTINEGSFRVELIAAIHNVLWLYQPGNTSPKLKFEIKGGLPHNSKWTSRKPGYFAPLSKWESKRI